MRPPGTYPRPPEVTRLLTAAGAELRRIRLARGLPYALPGVNAGEVYRAETGRGSLRPLVRVATAMGLTVRLVVEEG